MATSLGALAVSLGDPAGIGPEVLAKCWDNRDRFELGPFVAIGDARSITAVWDGPIATIDDPREADSAFEILRLRRQRSQLRNIECVIEREDALCGRAAPVDEDQCGTHVLWRRPGRKEGLRNMRVLRIGCLSFGWLHGARG